MQTSIQFIRRNIVTLILIALVIPQTAPNIAHAVDDIVTGNIVFNGPGQNGARDIHTTGNSGGMRFYNATNLSAIPDGAAIQFFGNGHTAFPGQAFIDSGAHNNAALIFRTAGTGQGIAERMRVTATGNVGIGTTNPQEQLQITGNLRLPATTATTGIIRSGTDTLLHTFGPNNFFAGIGAGNLTMTGASNTATGSGALGSLTTGDQNTATGYLTLAGNTIGGANTATGYRALMANTEGQGNTALGARALQSNTTGPSNTATGIDALAGNTSGASNTAVGNGALRNNTTGSENAGFGQGVLLDNTSGTENTVIGGGAMQANTIGSGNVAIGAVAGSANTTGSDNMFLGNRANASAGTFFNATAIGANATVGASNSLVLGGTGEHAVNVGIGTTTPQSTLQVSSGYLQFSATSAGAPNAADCNANAQRGRLAIDTTNNRLYVCNGATRAWDFVALSD